MIGSEYQKDGYTSEEDTSLNVDIASNAPGAPLFDGTKKGKTKKISSTPPSSDVYFEEISDCSHGYDYLWNVFTSNEEDPCECMDTRTQDVLLPETKRFLEDAKEKPNEPLFATAFSEHNPSWRMDVVKSKLQENKISVPFFSSAKGKTTNDRFTPLLSPQDPSSGMENTFLKTKKTETSFFKTKGKLEHEVFTAPFPMHDPSRCRDFVNNSLRDPDTGEPFFGKAKGRCEREKSHLVSFPMSDLFRPTTKDALLKENSAKNFAGHIAGDKSCHKLLATLSPKVKEKFNNDIFTTPSSASFFPPNIVTPSGTSCSSSDETLSDSSMAGKPKKRVRRNIEPTEKSYVDFGEVQDKDILFGRGGRTNHHPGNISFRERILEDQPAYKKCKNKTEKLEMIMEVVDWVKNEQNGHFLAIDDGRYYLATDEQARKKVGQYFRDDHTNTKAGAEKKET